jgi:hypothetical protein
MSHVDDGTLHAYLDGELSPPEAQGVKAHLAQCPGCRGRVEEERALITRAGELLAQAAPPDRELPPFRAGDVRPLKRLWWQVRLPLAWAATVAVALGIGTYLGSGSRVLMERPLAAPQEDQSRGFAAMDTSARLMRQRPPAEPRVAKRAAAPPPASARAIPEAAPEADRVGQRGVLAAPQPAPPAGVGFTLDSARAVLGQDPVVLPRAPIRAIRRDRRAGYAAVVVIEQQLDSGSVIELVEGRAAPANLDAAVVTATGEARAPDSVARLKGGRREAAPRADAPPAKLNAQLVPHDAQNRWLRRLGTLEIHISGPLPSDSLQKLLQLLQPVKP